MTKKKSIKVPDVEPLQQRTGQDSDGATHADEARRRATARKKRRKKKKMGMGTYNRSGYLLPYLIIPKNKQLARKVMDKMETETCYYKLSRATHVIKKLEEFAKNEQEEIDLPMDKEETEWREKKENELKGTFSKIKILNDKIERIKKREMRRRRKKEDANQEELFRKRYRVNPADPNYSYEPGYRKVRHRITKDRFMRCVDLGLFLEVLNHNPELLKSPLWEESLNLETLNQEDVRKLKSHKQQFEVIVEALKQGLFDLPKAKERIALGRVRKKIKNQKDVDPNKEYLRWLSKYKHTYKKRRKPDPNAKQLKKKMNYPPIYVERKTETNISSHREKDGWFSLVSNWLKPQTEPTTEVAEVNETFNTPVSNATETGPSGTTKIVKAPVPVVRPNVKRTKTGLKTGLDFPASLIARMSFSGMNPFSKFLTINIPSNLDTRKLLIYTLVESKVKKEPKMEQGIDEEEMALEQELRKLRVGRKDPMQRLHPDEQDSDVWTKTDTTTTDDYASWRRVPNLSKDENGEMGHAQDKSFHLRLLLLAIVLWEIGVFVKRVIDDVYYSILTFYLYRENIWLSDIHLASRGESYFLLVLVEWVHIVISMISLSIIKKKNECISLLFALSLLIHNFCDLAKDSHDGLIVTDGLNIYMMFRMVLLAVFKALKINLFIAYHYYSSDYIRKFREFRHRKTKLHNHEINAKGTKGLMKRRLAWNWMTRRARIQTLKGLKKKYPDVKDGNFPDEDLENQIKFVEAKELRLYAKRHNLNLGYPYNSLKDMKRYVFGESEKSDYTEDDEEDDRAKRAMQETEMKQDISHSLTVDKWRRWKQEQAALMQAKEELEKGQTERMDVVGPMTKATKAVRAKRESRRKSQKN